jgi:hypothetical protein
MAQNTEYTNLLSALEKHQESDTVDVMIPTTGTRGTFKKINVTQQKGVLKTAIDPHLPELLFVIQVNTILQDNQVTDTELCVTDRVSALLQLRSATLGSKLTSDSTSSSESLDITNHIKKFKKVKLPVRLQSSIIKHDVFNVECNIPTLQTDTEINRACLKIIQDKVKTEDGIKDSVGDIFVYEVIKYIKSISFIDQEQDQKIPFDTLSVQQRISVFEKLPMGVTAKISKYITSIRDFDDNFLNVSTASGEKDDTISIEFNAGLFSLE